MIQFDNISLEKAEEIANAVATMMFNKFPVEDIPCARTAEEIEYIRYEVENKMRVLMMVDGIQIDESNRIIYLNHPELRLGVLPLIPAVKHMPVYHWWIVLDASRNKIASICYTGPFVCQIDQETHAVRVGAPYSLMRGGS